MTLPPDNRPLSTPLPTAGPQPQKSSGCLRWFLICAGIVAFMFMLVVLVVWQFVSWIKNAPEPTAASCPALVLSEGEQEDVARVLTNIESVKKTRSDMDESISPAVFNGVLERMLEGERQKHLKQQDVPLFLRASLADNALNVKTSVPYIPALPAKMYLNMEIQGQVEIVEGEIKRLHVDKAVVRGTEAPFLGRFIMRFFTDAITQQNREPKNRDTNELRAIKLLKIEGGRLHVILDGKIMDEMDRKKAAQQQIVPQNEEEDKSIKDNNSVKDKEKDKDAVNKPRGKIEKHENDDL